MKKYFRYIRDENRRPMITRCLIYDPASNLVTFGQAVCSDKDSPSKKIGKAIAEGRAKKANRAVPEFSRKGDMEFVKRCRSPHFHIDQFLEQRELGWLHKQMEQEQQLCM